MQIAHFSSSPTATIGAFWNFTLGRLSTSDWSIPRLGSSIPLMWLCIRSIKPSSNSRYRFTRTKFVKSASLSVPRGSTGRPLTKYWTLPCGFLVKGSTGFWPNKLNTPNASNRPSMWGPCSPALCCCCCGGRTFWFWLEFDTLGRWFCCAFGCIQGGILSPGNWLLEILPCTPFPLWRVTVVCRFPLLSVVVRVIVTLVRVFPLTLLGNGGMLLLNPGFGFLLNVLAIFWNWAPCCGAPWNMFDGGLPEGMFEGKLPPLYPWLLFACPWNGPG